MKHDWRLLTMAVAGLLLVAAMAAWSDDCATTYTNFGQAFLTKYCNTCHSTPLVGAARRGAPSNVNFDQPELAAKFAARILHRTTVKANMPPAASTPQPTAEERAKVQAWIGCEFPR